MSKQKQSQLVAPQKGLNLPFWLPVPYSMSLSGDLRPSYPRLVSIDLVLQALQSQAKNHTEALTKLTQQYQEACTRLAAASADEAQAQQQASKLQQENQQLQQQVKQVNPARC